MNFWRKTIGLLVIFTLLLSFTGIALTTTAAEAEYNEAAMKDKLAKAHRVLAMNGHDDWLYGHMSFRVPGTNNFWIKSSTQSLDGVTSDALILLDSDCNPIGGSGLKKHIEAFIHAEMYKARPDVMAVIHTHPPNATALASMGMMIESLSNDAVMFINDQALYTKTSALITNAEMGADLAKTLGKNRLLLIRNHGIVMVGDSIEQAVVAAVFLEKAAEFQIICLQAGGAKYSASDKEIERSRNNRISQTKGMYNYLESKVSLD
ncbi:class II aldolase/adducin family protein [Selenomonadales bacterium OttesenSCG-928-I06]|nr:class II aldolase/adducin family protein [Selenomonadales bacterium OttesenSCG-928-I06]